MMKTKKMLSVLLAVMMLSSTAIMAGCNPSGGGGGGIGGGTGVTEKVDKNRTQLYVGNYNGGYGDVWLQALKTRFEEEYKDVSFETDKMGVQVIIDNKKEEYKSWENLSTTIEKSKNAIYFTEGISQKALIDGNYILEISDLLTTPLSEYGETESIQDKMDDVQKAYFFQNNKCYSLPTYNAFFGFIYDIDLFESYGLYFAADTNNGNDGFVIATTDAKSNGPDGKSGTSDDGLPATYDDFFKLCDRMQDAGIMPLIWSGEYESSYIRQLAGALWADYEGKENALKFYSLTGSVEVVDSIDANGNATLKTIDMSTANGYEVYGQAGRYYSLKFIEQMVRGGAIERYWQGMSFNLTQSHTNAQEDYLYSKYEQGSKPIAMLADGVWWQSEADLVFSDMEEGGYGSVASKANRKFGFMPMPKATSAQVGEKVTLLDMLGAKVFVNANVANNSVQKDLASKFIRFIHTDKSLSEFQGITNIPKAFNYTLAAEDEAKLTHFGKVVSNMAQTADIVYEYPLNAMVEGMQNTGNTLSAYMTTIERLPYSDVGRTFNQYSFTAKDYFVGIRDYYYTNWQKFGG